MMKRFLVFALIVGLSVVVHANNDSIAKQAKHRARTKAHSDTRHPQSTITAGERQLLERSEAKGREAVMRSETQGCGDGI